MTLKGASFLTFALAASLSAHAAVSPLAAERWKTRPVIVVARDAASVPPSFSEQNTRAAFAERQVVVFTIIGGAGQRDGKPLDPAATAALLATLGLQPDSPTTMLLIGKDGGVKLSRPQLSVEQILSAIDRMPMRRSEVKS
jgi:hypothetical protein